MSNTKFTSKKIPELIMGGVISILLILAIAIPIIQGSIDNSTLTKINEGILQNDINPEEEWSAEFSYASNIATATVNNVEYTTNETSFVFSSNQAIVIFNEATVILYYFDSETNTSHNISNMNSLEISVVNGVCNIVGVKNSDNIDYEFTYKWAFGYDPNGEYVSKYIQAPGITYYVNSIEDIYGAFQTNNSKFYFMEGNKVYVENSTTAINATVNTGATTSSDVKSVFFTRSTTECDYLFEYNSNTEYPIVVVVPNQVSGLIDGKMTSMEVTLLEIVPIILIVGVIISVVRYFYSERK